MTCPLCGSPNFDADFVDIGVGEIQCGPYGCPDCHAVQVDPHDEPDDRTIIDGCYVGDITPIKGWKLKDGVWCWVQTTCKTLLKLCN